jgi:hypothetical protein
VPREPVTTATVPAPPPTFLGSVLLATMAFLVLFVLPPCATSPTVDLIVLTLIGGRAGWTLVRCLQSRQGATRPPVSLPLPSADVGGDRNGVP